MILQVYVGSTPSHTGWWLVADESVSWWDSEARNVSCHPGGDWHPGVGGLDPSSIRTLLGNDHISPCRSRHFWVDWFSFSTARICFLPWGVVKDMTRPRWKIGKLDRVGLDCFWDGQMKQLHVSKWDWLFVCFFLCLPNTWFSTSAMVFTNALEYDPFQIPKNQWSTHSVTDTDGGGFNFLHPAKLGGRLSKGKLGYPCRILPYAAIIYITPIYRWYMLVYVSVTLPRLPNSSLFETFLFASWSLFQVETQKTGSMRWYEVLEKHTKPWRNKLQSGWKSSTENPEKKQPEFLPHKKMGHFLCFPGWRELTFFLDLANSTQQRWRLKCHIGKLMMPSRDTKATWDSKVVGMRTFESLVGHFDISGHQISMVLMVDHVVFFFGRKNS